MCVCVLHLCWWMMCIDLNLCVLLIVKQGSFLCVGCTICIYTCVQCDCPARFDLFFSA